MVVGTGSSRVWYLSWGRGEHLGSGQESLHGLVFPKARIRRNLPASCHQLPKSQNINSVAFEWSSQSLRTAQMREGWTRDELYAICCTKQAACGNKRKVMAGSYLWRLTTTRDNFPISSLLRVDYSNHSMCYMWMEEFFKLLSPGLHGHKPAPTEVWVMSATMRKGCYTLPS